MKELEIEKLHPLTTSAHSVIIAITLYQYNVAPMKQITALFPDAHPDYIDSKILRFKESFITFWGSLDSQNQRKYVSNALEKYDEESQERANKAMIESFMEG